MIRRLAALSADDRWLLAHAATVVAAARIALWIFPFPWICGQVRRPAALSSRLAAMPADRLAWAVQAAARRVPQASCLTQAIALLWLLIRADRVASLKIGVAKGTGHGFEFHSWVECEGRCLLETGEQASRFASFLSLCVESA